MVESTHPRAATAAAAALATDSRRERHVRWADPLATLQRAAEMSREEMLVALTSGELPRPPIAELLGIDAIEASQGHAVFGLRPSECHSNPLGSVAAGVTATVLDAAMWLAVQTRVPDSTIVSTVALTQHLVRALPTAAGYVRAQATAVHVGARTATAEARLIDDDGKLYCHATAGFHCASFGSAM